jgi:hypothetical protein
MCGGPLQGYGEEGVDVAVVLGLAGDVDQR